MHGITERTLEPIPIQQSVGLHAPDHWLYGA